MATLDQLRPGDQAAVLRITASGTLAQRLGEMGLIEGETVRMVRAAPLGDPIEIELHDYFLSLRKAEARFVEVSDS